MKKTDKVEIKKTELISQPKNPPGIKTSMDSSALKTVIIEKKSEVFVFNPEEKTNIIMLMKDVDLVYQNEARRALAGFHARKFSEKGIEIKQDKIGTIPMLVISSFKNTVDAIEYLELVKQLGPKELFPWLPKEKYSLVMVSPDNLNHAQEEKSIENYLQFIRIKLPGKF